MTHASLTDVQDYTVLRQTGSSPLQARTQLRLRPAAAERLEKVFRARAARGQGDRQLPRFARHDRHVAAVLAAGGFWAFSERRVGRDGMVICLPLVQAIP